MIIRKRKLFLYLLDVSIAAFAAGLFFIERTFFDEENAVLYRPWSEIEASDTLRVATVSTSTTAFYTGKQWMGHEYEIGEQVAKSLGLTLDVILVDNYKTMMDSLRTASADIALWPVTIDSTQMDIYRYCGYQYPVSQVFFGPKANVRKIENDTVPFTLCVLAHSRQMDVLNDTALNHYVPHERFNVSMIDNDSVLVEDLADWVMHGKYDLTIVDEPLGELYKTYYPSADISKAIPGSARRVSWVVAASADTLAQKIDSICRDERKAPHYPAIVKRYFERVKSASVSIKFILGHGSLSVYDSLYKKYAKTLGWDWRLLAAISFEESRFDPHVTSSRGARGLMQLMPPTAKHFGCEEHQLNDPEANIAAGARYLNFLQNRLKDKLVRMETNGSAHVVDSYAEADSTLKKRIDSEVLYFVIGSFHAGLGHIYDALYLADTLGYDVTVWEDNVEHCIELKSDSAYYNLPCVKLGRFAGNVTSDYVAEVWATYLKFKELAK